MEKKEDTEIINYFKCSSCSLYETYDYFGQTPPFSPAITFMEKTYVKKDPFSPAGRGLFIVLGSHCALCDNTFCQSSECSIFYTKRFCISCVKKNTIEFPPEILQEIKRQIN